MKFSAIFLACTFFCMKPVFSQTAPLLEEALIVNKNNDTIACRIIMKDEKSILRSVSGINSRNDTFSLKANEIQRLIITKYNILFEPVTIQNKAKTAEQTILAKVLCKGSASLYKIEAAPETFDLPKGKEPFFIIKSAKGTFPLIANKHDYDRIAEKYIGVLNYALTDCPDFGKQIKNTTHYSTEPLVHLIISYNNCAEPGLTHESMVEKKLPIQFSHQIMTSIALASCPESFNTNGSVHSKIFAGVGFGYMMDILSPSVSKKTSIRTGIQYVYIPKQDLPYYYYLDKPGSKVDLSTFRIPFTGNFLLSYNKVAPFLQAGGTIEFLARDLSAWTPCFNLGAGIKINRVSCLGTFEIPLNILDILKERKVFQFKLAYTFAGQN